VKVLQQIQADILDQGLPVSAILRKAKVLAAQLGSEDLSSWASQELDGYEDIAALPDYRILNTGTSGRWTNGYHAVNNQGVPLFRIDDEELKKILTRFNVDHGIRTVEQLANDQEGRKFILSPDVTALVNHYVSEGGYGYTSLHYSLSPHHFEQILDTVRNRLLDLILSLDKRWTIEDTPPPKEEVGRLVSVVIYNNPEGASVSMFDQRGQQVQYQFNAAGDINVESVTNVDQLSDQLSKLRSEIEVARQARAIPDDAAIEAEFHVLQATRKARADEPDKASMLDHIGKAKALLGDLAAAAGLVGALAKAAEQIGRLL